MSNVLGSLIIRLAADTTAFNNGLNTAENRLTQTANAMNSAGRTMAYSITAPLVGIGTAAIATSTQLNEGLANIASLGLATDRVMEFKDAIQGMAVDVGKRTDDLTQGMYEVISTFGDSADATDILKSNAIAAAAGLATTQDAIRLTSAVTKAYGEVNAQTVQHVADLAFQTVNLGQTTFPELAASIGHVTPIAAALGVTQEELFGQLATLTGVTGSTAEVVTQLRATYQAILRPSKEMQHAIADVAVELERQGKLASGPMVDAWRTASQQHEASAQKLMDMRKQLEALEAGMGASSGAAQALTEQLVRQRLEAKEAENALRAQIDAVDTSTDAGKQQAAALEEQLTQLKSVNEQREIDLQKQLLAAGSSKQLKEQYNELNKAVKEQEKLVDGQGRAVQKAAAALGTSIVKSAGLNETLQMLGDTAGGNTNVLAKMMHSVEALTAVLALSGGQSEDLKKKYAAMQNVTGVTAAAFEAQTNGINKSGFTMQQVAVKAELLMQKLGDGLAPALGSLLEVITPLIDKAGEWADWFANADASTQKWIVTMAAVAAAAGPVLIVLSTLITVVTTVGGAISGLVGLVGTVAGAIGALTGIGATFGAIGSTLLAFVTGPIGLTIAAVAALVVAWRTNFLGIRDIAYSAWEGIKAAFRTGLDAVKSLAVTGWQTITATWQNHRAEVLAVAAKLWDGATATFGLGFDTTKGITVAAWQAINGDWRGAAQTLQATNEANFNRLNDLTGGRLAALRDLWVAHRGEVLTAVTGLLEAIKNLFVNADWPGIGRSIIQGIATGITSAGSWLQEAASQAAQSALDAAKNFLGIHSPSTVAAEVIGVPFAEGIGEGALRGLDAIAAQLDAGLAGLLGGVQPTSAFPAGAGVGGISITQNFYGDADRNAVRSAAQDGVLAGLRQRGIM